jgi:rhomboid family GlyGly-CTERM serine protease
MLNLPLQLKYSLGPIAIVLISLGLAFAGIQANEYFAYDRVQFEHHQWWRLITGHFLHTNSIHLMLNLAGLILLWALHGHYYHTSKFFLVFLLLCLGTSLCLYVFSVDLQWYVGLSGVLHGLFVIGAYYDIRHNFKTGWLMLIGVWLKVLHEQIYGASSDISGWIEANVAIDAHLFGTLVGSLLVVYYFIKSVRQQKKSNQYK